MRTGRVSIQGPAERFLVTPGPSTPHVFPGGERHAPVGMTIIHRSG